MGVEVIITPVELKKDDDIDREAEVVSGPSCPVLASIDGFPNLLPPDNGLDTTKPDDGEAGTEDEIESEADFVLGPNRPVLASIEGCPNLLTPDDNPIGLNKPVRISLSSSIGRVKFELPNGPKNENNT